MSKPDEAPRAAKRATAIVTTSDQPTEKSAKMGAEPVPSQEVLELQQKLAKLEQDRVRAIRIAGEHQTRIEFLEGLIDKKLDTGDGGEAKKMAADQQKKIVELTSHREELVRRLTTIDRSEKRLMEEQQEKIDELMRNLAAADSREKEQQKTMDELTCHRDDLARKLTFVDGSEKRQIEEQQEKIDELTRNLAAADSREKEQQKTIEELTAHRDDLARKLTFVEGTEKRQIEEQQEKIDELERRLAVAAETEKRLMNGHQRKFIDVSNKLNALTKKMREESARHTEDNKKLAEAVKQLEEARRKESANKMSALTQQLEKKKEGATAVQIGDTARMSVLDDNRGQATRKLPVAENEEKKHQMKLAAVVKAVPDESSAQSHERKSCQIKKEKPGSTKDRKRIGKLSKKQPLRGDATQPQPLVAVKQEQQTADPSMNKNFFKVLPVDTPDSIAYEDAHKVLCEIKKVAIAAVSGGNTNQIEQEFFGEMLGCSACKRKFRSEKIIDHFLSAAHGNKVFAPNTAISHVAFKYWALKLLSVAEKALAALIDGDSRMEMQKTHDALKTLITRSEEDAAPAKIEEEDEQQINIAVMKKADEAPGEIKREVDEE